MIFLIFTIIAILTGDVICKGLGDKHEDSNNFKIRSDGISAISNVYRKISPKENIEEIVLVPHRLRQVKFLNADFKWIPGSTRKVKGDKKRVENFELFSKREQPLSKIKKLLMDRESTQRIDDPYNKEDEDPSNKRENYYTKPNTRLFIDDNGGTNNYYRLMQEYNKLNGDNKVNSKITNKDKNIKYENTKLNTYNPGPKVTKIILTNVADTNELKDTFKRKYSQLEKNACNEKMEDIKCNDNSMESGPLLITESNGYKLPAHSHQINNVQDEEIEDVISTSGDFTNELQGKGISKNKKNNVKYDSVYNVPGKLKSFENSKNDDMSITFNIHEENNNKNRKGYSPYKSIENSVKEDKGQLITNDEGKSKQEFQTGNNAAAVYTMENGEFYRENPILSKKYKNKNLNYKENSEIKSDTSLGISEYNKQPNIVSSAHSSDDIKTDSNCGYNRKIDKIINNLSTIKSGDSLRKNDKHSYLNGDVSYSQNPNNAEYMNFEQHSLLKNEINQIHQDDSIDPKEKTINLDNRERINSPMPSSKIYGVTAKPNINSIYYINDATKKQEIPVVSSLESVKESPLENYDGNFYNNNFKGTTKFSAKFSTTPVTTRHIDTNNMYSPTHASSFIQPSSVLEAYDVQTPLNAFMIAQKAAEKALHDQKAQNSAAIKASMEVRKELAKKAEIASDAANESITDKQVIVDLLEEIADNMKKERESIPNKDFRCHIEQAVGMARDEVDITHESLDNAKRMCADLQKISDGIHDIKVRSELSLEAEKMKIASLRDRIDDERLQMCELQHKIEELKACKKKKKRRRFRLFKWSRETDALKRHVK